MTAPRQYLTAFPAASYSGTTSTSTGLTTSRLIDQRRRLVSVSLRLLFATDGDHCLETQLVKTQRMTDRGVPNPRSYSYITPSTPKGQGTLRKKRAWKDRKSRGTVKSAVKLGLLEVIENRQQYGYLKKDSINRQRRGNLAKPSTQKENRWKLRSAVSRK